jgi:hypothetical protein
VSRTTTERAAQRAGVWDADAPDGYVALAVFNSAGQRILRVEIHADFYSTTWVLWLERWLRRWDSKFLRVVR